MTAKTRANLKINPLTSTQFADGQAVPGEQFVHIADSMAYQAEVDSLTSTVNAIAGATGLFTAINNGSGETGTVWTVDSTTGFLAGMTITYALNDGTIKTNTIASVDSATQITVSTSESGTLADNAIVAAVAPGLAGAALRWFDIRVYGASTSATDNSTAIQAAITAAGAVKGAVFIPAGTWAVQAKLTVDANIAIVGTGRGSIIKNTGSTDTIEFGTGAAAVECVVRDVTLWNASGAGHIVTCETKGMLNSVWDGVFFDQDSTAKRCLNVNISGTGSAYQNVAHNDCVFDITKTHTVSAIQLTSESSRFNGTKWTGGEWHAYGAQVTFCEIYTTSTSTYNYGQIFRGITIEQTTGGALHIKAGYGTLVEDCVIYDTFAVTTSTTGSITGITQANPGVVTSTSHGLSNGDRITISGVAGMTQVNSGYFTVANAAANTFELSGVNTSGYTAYSSGGTWTKLQNTTDHQWEFDRATTNTTGSVTGVTNANPAVVTSTAHGLSNGNVVSFSGVGGMTQLNGNTYTVANATANTFELSGINSTGYGTYTSGGTWTQRGLTCRYIHIRNCHRVDTQNPLGSSKYDIALTSAAQVFITNCAGNQAAGVNHNINNSQCVIQRGLSADMTLTNRNSANSIILDYQSVTAPTFTGNWAGEITGHVQMSTQTAPTVAVLSAAGSGAGGTATIQANSTDSAGRCNVTTGSSGVTTGAWATVTFNSAFNTAPHVVVTGGNAATCALTFGVTNVGTTSFQIYIGAGTPATSTAHVFYWQAVE